MKHRNFHGFTLIELLIVVAIIGILLSIVLANIASSREKAEITSFKQKTNSLEAAIINLCDSMALPNAATIVSNLRGGALPDGLTFSDGDIVTTNCGPGGTQVFRINVHSTKLTTPCVGTVQQTGVTSWTGC